MTPRPKSPASAGGDKGERPGAQDSPYCDGFQHDELDDLQTLLEGPLSSEISMLRAVTRRLFTLVKGLEDIQATIEALRALGMAATRLSSLLRTQAELDSKYSDKAMSELSAALQEIVVELELNV